jgi:signal transduction histidine kinase
MTGYLFAGACIAMLCACFGAGRAALPLRWTAAVAAGAVCVPAAQFLTRPAGLAAVTGFASACLVFGALPLLAGRYVAQQRRLAEQERLAERLRIAREMHDSLGRRLSLASVQAAALEVSDLPGAQRAAMARLATEIRASGTELHEILGVLRGEPGHSRGLPDVSGLIKEFCLAGAAVSVNSLGRPQPLGPEVDQAAYRVVEEGLTNAIRHAAGQPVSVTVAWDAGALRLTVVNPADRDHCTPGFGLTELASRLRRAGGTLSHELSGGQFRLCATLPATPVPKAWMRPGGNRRARRPGVTALGLAAGILLLVVLPAAVLLGAR